MSDTWRNEVEAAPETPAATFSWRDQVSPSGPTAQQKAVVSSSDNAEEAGRALKIGKKTGLPPTVVQGDLPGYDAHLRQQSAIKAVQNPYLEKYVNGNPMAASVSSGDWDNLDEVSQTLQALHPELVKGRAQVGVVKAVPEIAGMLGSQPGREKLWSALKQLPGALGQGILDFIETPGKAMKSGLSLEEEIGFGVGAALGTGRVTAGRAKWLEGIPGTPKNNFLFGNEAALATSFDDFMATIRGMKTRQEIDDFLASKQPGPPGAMLQIEHAKAGAEALDKAVEVAQKSKTKELAPELFEEAAQAHDPGNVHIDGKKIVELYEKEGKVPAEGDGLLGFVPDLAAKAQAAAATGGEVTIPVSKYIAHVDEATHEGLKEAVRLHDDGVTALEAEEAKSAIEAWHGTPHDFEQFDLTKIGTGEGAQVYGHGLYFAENRGVAKNYQEQLSGGETIVERVDGKFGIKNQEGEDSGLVFETREEAEKALNKGQLYKVSINADPTKFLDWDKPFSEQSKHVQDVIDSLAKTPAQMELYKSGLPLGEAMKLGHLPGTFDINSPEFSKMYSEAGIPGIKYLDQGSRASAAAKFPNSKIEIRHEEGFWNVYIDGELESNFGAKSDAEKAAFGTRNFVVFDDRLVKITEKNGEPVAALVEAAVETEKLFMGLKTTPFMNMLFEKGKSLGITETEIKKYSEKIANQELAILDRAVAVGKREAAKRLSPEWKRNEATVKDEVTNELTNSGAFAAERYLRNNKIDIAHERAADVADDLAPLFGFETGQDLLRGLQAIEIEKAASGKGPQRQLADAIKAETAARMEERYGDLKENIAKEAREIALAGHTFDILADEVRLLAKAAGVSPPLSRADMVAWAEAAFEQRNIKDAVNWKAHERAVAKGGRETEKALLSQKFQEAFQLKQEQFLATVWAKESNKLAALIDRVEGKIDRFLSEQVIDSIDQAHLEQIRQMLAAVGLPQSFAPLQGTPSLADFVALSDGQIAVAPWLMGRPPKLQDFTVAQFREFADSLKSLEHAGRESQIMTSAQDRATVQNVIHDIGKELERFDLIKQPLNPSLPQRVGSMIRWISAAHTLVEKVFDYTDQFNPNGPITKWIDRPLRDSNTKEIQLTERVSKQLRDLVQYTDSSINDTIPQKVIWDKLTDTWLNMDRGNLRQLAMYMGAWENIAKVVEGFGVNEADVRRLLHDQMTEKDWNWVSGMWKIFADLHVDAAEMVLRDTGVPLAQKTPAPLTTPFGEVSGGYAPLIYDRKRSNIQGDIAAKGDLFEPEFFTAGTSHGYTEELTQYAGFLDLTGIQTAPKIATMIHDIAFREAVRNAAKVIYNEEFMAAMSQKWGVEIAGLFQGWLKDIANVKNVDDQYAVGAARVMAGLRNNITSALIAFNPGTYMKHGGTAAAMSVRQVGAKELAIAAKELGIKSIWENARDLVQSTDARPTPEFVDALQEITDNGAKGEALREFILASSAVMRNRQRKAQDSIRGAYESASESGPLQTAKDFRHDMMNLGRVPVALTDTMSAMPTWWAAYKKAKFVDGLEHDDAVFIADKEMSRAHGSNFIGDKPRVMRTGEAMRWVTPLYNFWNHNFNNHLQLAWDAAASKKGPIKYEGPMADNGLPAPNVLEMFEKNGTWYYKEEQGASFGRIANALFWISVVPIIVHELAAPPKDEHAGSLGAQMLKATAQHYGSMIIGVRDIANAALNGYDPSIGTIGTSMQILKNAGADIRKTAQGKRARDGIAHAVTLLGAATGVLGQAPGKALQFGADVYRRLDRPQNVTDIRQGLRTGHSKARRLK